ncbi:class I SAM-dependent methyltransferase [Acinetobacter sp.]|uniref:class I SAM-dependent methyltransferase n=1 Tax=Acinetobacter sp. TaxID=472 RepID=UPI002FC7EDCC
MKDLFSKHSALYRQARPGYSAAIIEEILKHAPARELAWDCGAGSGQFTQWLAPHFQRVLATDISAPQLAQAPQLENVTCRAAPAEQSGLPAQSADLVTVAQAIHWFDFDAFYAEARRVLKSDGCLAVTGYGLIEAENPDLNRLIRQLYFETLKGCWDAERRYVDELYRTIPFPFQEQTAPALQLQYRWTGGQLLNYFNTWSGLRHYAQQGGQHPLAALAGFFAQERSAQHSVRFPVLLRIGKL